jgi:hypothetical protein
VSYIKSRLRRHFAKVEVYPVGVLDGLVFDPERATNGSSTQHDDKMEWKSLGGGEFVVQRLPLPVIS